MLNKSSVLIGVNLGTVLAERGMKIVPKKTTLLGELDSAVKRNMLFQSGHSAGAEEIASYILTASEGDMVEVSRDVFGVSDGRKNYQESPHDTLMDNYKVDLSQLVARHIAFARNVVNAEMNMLLDDVREALPNCKYNDAEDFFSITYYSLPAVFKSELMDELRSYGGGGGYVYSSLPLLSQVNADFDALGYLLIGDESVDAVLGNHLGTLGKEQLIHLLTEKISEISLPLKDLLNYSLVNYLFYRNLTARTDLNLGVGMVELQTLAAKNRDYFGNQLAVAVSGYESLVRTGILMSSDSQMNFSVLRTEPCRITVYQETFDKLAENGVPIEALFGYIASLDSVPNITVDALTEASVVYQQKWASVRSMYTATLVNGRLDAFKRVLTRCFEESIKRKMNEDEASFLNTHAGFVDQTLKLAYAFIDDLHLSDIECLEKVVLELVAGIRYRFTNAYFILKEMQEMLAISETMTPMEAALIASTKLVTDFLMENADLVKV